MCIPFNSKPEICLSLRFLFPASSLPHFSDESNLKMNSVDHIPQTLASHILLPEEVRSQGLEGGGINEHGADMLKPDPRDTFYSSKSTHHHYRLSPFSVLSCSQLYVWLRHVISSDFLCVFCSCPSFPTPTVRLFKPG